MQTPGVNPRGYKICYGVLRNKYAWLYLSGYICYRDYVERRFKVLSSVIILVVAIVLFPNDWQEILFTTTSPSDPLVVTKIVDGDTIKLANGETIRYIGIDTPETKHPSKSKQCYGAEASERNKELVFGKKIELTYDVSETDKYGRVLAYVWVDGKMVNEQLVEEGFAFAKAYPPDLLYQEEFDKLQNIAKKDFRGLWKECMK